MTPTDPAAADPAQAPGKIDALIATWSGLPGGAERKNFAPFIYDLIDALDLPRPGPGELGKLGDYEFEGTVAGGSAKQTGAGFCQAALMIRSTRPDRAGQPDE